MLSLYLLYIVVLYNIIFSISETRLEIVGWEVYLGWLCPSDSDGLLFKMSEIGSAV